MAKKNILIVSPHPDDETLGAGGTLLRHHDMGDRLFWVILTRMGESFSLEKRKQRQLEIERVTSLYGFTKRFDLPFDAMALEIYPLHKIIEAVSAVFREVCPEVVYLPFSGDVHSDHRVAFDVCFPCTKAFRCPSVKKVLMYEVPSETDFASPVREGFHPNVFVDISATLEKKLKALSLFESELGEHPFPRSLEGVKSLAMVRGAASNVTYAEAFVLLKEII